MRKRGHGAEYRLQQGHREVCQQHCRVLSIRRALSGHVKPDMQGCACLHKQQIGICSPAKVPPCFWTVDWP